MDGVSEQTPQQGRVWRAKVRRAPRYEVFIGAGVVLGVLVGVIGGLTGAAEPDTGRARLVAYLAVGCAILGALLAGLVAVAIERFGRGRG